MKKIYQEMKKGEWTEVPQPLVYGEKYMLVLKKSVTLADVSHVGVAGIGFSYNSPILYSFWGPKIRTGASPWPLVARFDNKDGGIDIGVAGSVGSIYKPKRYPKKIPLPR